MPTPTKRQEHTPTPWQVTRHTPKKHTGLPDSFSITSDTNPGIAGMYGDGQANAEFIIRAVNSHAALVEALESICAELSDHPEVNRGNSKAHYVFHQARAALEGCQ